MLYTCVRVFWRSNNHLSGQPVYFLYSSHSSLSQSWGTTLLHTYILLLGVHQLSYLLRVQGTCVNRTVCNIPKVPPVRSLVTDIPQEPSQLCWEVCGYCVTTVGVLVPYFVKFFLFLFFFNCLNVPKHQDWKHAEVLMTFNLQFTQMVKCDRLLHCFRKTAAGWAATWQQS